MFGQNPLKDVDPSVFTMMLRKDGRTDGSVTITLRNFVGEGIIRSQLIIIYVAEVNFLVFIHFLLLHFSIN
jgi:hypothetical protein